MPTRPQVHTHQPSIPRHPVLKSSRPNALRTPLFPPREYRSPHPRVRIFRSDTRAQHSASHHRSLAHALACLPPLAGVECVMRSLLALKLRHGCVCGLTNALFSSVLRPQLRPHRMTSLCLRVRSPLLTIQRAAPPDLLVTPGGQVCVVRYHHGRCHHPK